MSDEIVPTEVSENQEIEESNDVAGEMDEVVSAIDGDSDETVDEEVVSEEEDEEVSEESPIDPEVLKKVLKLKVDGEEIEEIVDLNDEEGLIKKLQLAHAAQKRMQESAVFKKQVNDFFSLLQSDPTAALSELGLNVDDIAKNHLEKIVQDAEMSPEEKKLKETQDELEQLRKKAKETEDSASQLKMERLKDQYAADIEKDITGAIESLPDLPKSPYVIKRMADAMMLAMNNGYPDIQAKDVLPVVHKQIKDEIGQMFGVMPEDVLEGFIGKGNIDRLRQKRISKAKKGKTETAKQAIQAIGTQPSESVSEKISMNDFFKDPLKTFNK